MLSAWRDSGEQSRMGFRGPHRFAVKCNTCKSSLRIVANARETFYTADRINAKYLGIEQAFYLFACLFDGAAQCPKITRA